MSIVLNGTDSVSIIIVNYNAGSSLTGCVAQILTQAGGIIVVDNASSDNSLDDLESTFPGDSRLKIVRNNRNLGFAAACNIGAELATGDLFLFINPDSYLHSYTVEKLASNLVNNPDVAITGGLLLYPDGTEQGGDAGPCRHPGAPLSVHLVYRASPIGGRHFFLIFTCTSSHCLMNPLRWRRFLALA